jgi:ABC-type dipeptide/oligopeptide/nickel transport system permease component
VGAYLIRRFAQALLVLIGVSLCAFALIHLVPGNPARVVLGIHASPASIARLDRQLGLDKPLVTQYVQFITHALVLNFGTSFTQGVSVASLVGPRLGVTLWLTIYASILAVLIAVPLALWSAQRRNRPSDHGIRVITMITFAMPPFWLGLLLILLLAIKLPIFPASGYSPGIGGHLKGFTLPALCLALGLAPLLLRTLRTSLIETLSTEFVEAARARGLSDRRVLYRYALRNSLVATITVLGVNIGYLLGGTVVVENVFNLQGLGSLLVSGVSGRDYPTVEALVLIFGFLVVVVNLVTDLTYGALDPRVRL